MIRRRQFIAGFGSAAAWPVLGRAQQAAVPVVGWLHAGELPTAEFVAAFRQGLNELGYIEGRNVKIELRNSEQNDRLPDLASEFASRPVTAMFAGNLAAAVAARAATATIPIVFAIGGDPIRDGLVTSLSRPTGNLTGVTFFAGELLPKRLALLRQLVPKADLVAVLLNPTNPNLQTRLRDMQAAARTMGLRLFTVNGSNESDIDTAFAAVIQAGAAALLVVDDPFLGNHREQIIALAARHALPTSYSGSQAVRDGGLMGYSDDRSESIRQVGRYVGRILKGEKLANLPVFQPTRFELVINLKTAKALGLTIPETLLATADEVIQ
jgi:putative tryptophan/tyrosine transport system substrate-binding protein